MSTDEPKQYLVQRIREALAHDPRVSDPELSVTVRGDKVFVAGFVSTEDRREAIFEVVAEVAPDHELHNETKVAVVPGGTEEETVS